MKPTVDTAARACNPDFFAQPAQQSTCRCLKRWFMMSELRSAHDKDTRIGRELLDILVELRQLRLEARDLRLLILHVLNTAALCIAGRHSSCEPRAFVSKG